MKETAPRLEFSDLETLWLQVSGTLCNLRCSHCFISCAPDNHSLEMMPAEQIYGYLDEARRLGVKEIYYTGGEPFLHKRFFEILERTLRDFPVSILTNGLLINDKRADRLQKLMHESPYSLEIRISLDSFDREFNDKVRGRGTYDRILAACGRLFARGFLPILTVTEIEDYLCPEPSPLGRYQRYSRLLESVGVTRPRVKIIPVFEMGKLPSPEKPNLLSEEMMEGFDPVLLQCHSSRIAARDGVYACPILVGEEQARMSRDSLEEALQPCSLYHTACTTCYLTGMTCRNH